MTFPAHDKSQIALESAPLPTTERTAPADFTRSYAQCGLKKMKILISFHRFHLRSEGLIESENSFDAKQEIFCSKMFVWRMNGVGVKSEAKQHRVEASFFFEESHDGDASSVARGDWLFPKHFCDSFFSRAIRGRVGGSNGRFAAVERRHLYFHAWRGNGFEMLGK